MAVVSIAFGPMGCQCDVLLLTFFGDGTLVMALVWILAVI